MSVINLVFDPAVDALHGHYIGEVKDSNGIVEEKHYTAIDTKGAADPAHIIWTGSLNDFNHVGQNDLRTQSATQKQNDLNEEKKNIAARNREEIRDIIVKGFTSASDVKQDVPVVPVAAKNKSTGTLHQVSEETANALGRVAHYHRH